MPRILPPRVRLSRVRFRPSPPPRIVPSLPSLTPESLPADPYEKRYKSGLKRQAEKIALRASRAEPLKIEKLAKATWQQTKPGRNTRAEKPFTLRNLADPEGKARQHGQLIFVFKNIKTNQVLYSLSEVLEEHHLKQLPFYGKHSSPPTLRRDLWTPHCVVNFPTPEQGHNAFRKLREFRKLHELSWHETSPEWGKFNKKTLIGKIMRQDWATSADLAEVLRIQTEQGEWMQEKFEEREKMQSEYMGRKWPEVEALAKLAESGELQRLKSAVNSLNGKLKNIRPGKNEKGEQRYKAALTNHQTRIKKLLWAQRKVQAFQVAQKELEEQAKPAMEEGLEEKIEQLTAEIAAQESEFAELPDFATSEAEKLRERITGQQRELSRLENRLGKALWAQSKVDARDNHVVRSILPHNLSKPFRTPYTTEGLLIQWADLRYAEYASQWPRGVIQGELPLTEELKQTAMMRLEEYQNAIEEDRDRIVGQYLEEVKALIESEGTSRKDDEDTGLSRNLPKVLANKNTIKHVEV